LPDAFVVINPKISNPQSPVSHLSGAGVAFKIAQALSMSAPHEAGGSNSPFSIHDFFDLAALGTIADVVPITEENRVIVKEGLKLLENGTGPGLTALKSVSGIERRGLKTGLLLFTIIPRINAAGRISDSHKVVQLLLTDSEDEAIEIASWLDKLNSERQEIEEGIYQEAMNRLNKKGIGSAIVLSSEGWHRGVIGIVASRIAEVFCRPTFIVSIEGEIARGSARSIPSFDIYRGLTHCREFLTDFGGHKQAAGFKLKSEDILSFEEKMNRIVNESVSNEDFVPALKIDASVNLSDITSNLIRELDMLEPLGFGNPVPLLGSKGLEVLNTKIVGNNHLKMKLKQRSHTIDTIGFDMAEFVDTLEVSTTIDAVFVPFINEWEGGRCLQLNLKAFRPSIQ
ncbi:MAG: DHH family phosphoesterase, partial [Nitrospirota bacterium]|nr:DHH family phosphoesterase [Nitrospirota bacterium]